MNPLYVIIAVAVLCAIAPFVLRIHRSALVWITLLIVNFIIISLYVIVKDTLVIR